MGKLSIREIRRTELAQAAFDELMNSGLSGTTLERVAKRAGVSKSVVLHHFRDKEELFVAAMRKMNAIYADYVVALMRHADTPLERIYAVVVANFSEPIFQRAFCHGWISLCAAGPQRPLNQRLQKVAHRRMDSNFIGPLRSLIPNEAARDGARQIRTLIDGLWLRASLTPDPCTTDMALGEMNFAIASLLRAHGAGDLPHEAACQKMHALSRRLQRPPRRS